MKIQVKLRYPRRVASRLVEHHHHHHQVPSLSLSLILRVTPERLSLLARNITDRRTRWRRQHSHHADVQPAWKAWQNEPCLLPFFFFLFRGYGSRQVDCDEFFFSIEWQFSEFSMRGFDGISNEELDFENTKFFQRLSISWRLHGTIRSWNLTAYQTRQNNVFFRSNELCVPIVVFNSIRRRFLI